MRVLLCAFVLCLVATPSLAQTNPVPAGQPFTVQFDHDGMNVTGFQCLLDGKPLGAVLPTTGRQCVVPAQTAGVHTVAVEAVNAFGKAASAPLSVTAGSPPLPPVQLRIVVQVAVQPSGEVTLLAASVAREP